MDDLQREELERACVLIGEAIARVAEYIQVIIDGIVAEAARVAKAYEQDQENRNLLEDLQRAFDEFAGVDLLQQIADNSEDIPPPKTIPRPPKSLLPVNKVNYSVNKPPRRARSSCRFIKRR